MSDLKERLEKLKEYSNKTELESLNKRIFDLKLDSEFLEKSPQDRLIYIHVKLHNAASYKKPFAPLSDIKKYHDLVAKFLRNHVYIDPLDD